jgi:periplasmic protein TonB
MFEQTFVDGVGKTKKTWTVMLAFAAQIVLIVVAVIVPMIYFDVLPKTQLTSMLVAPPPPPPPPPPPAEVPQVKVVKVIPRQFDAGRLMAPKNIPKDIAVIREDELPPPASSMGVGGGFGATGGAASGVLGSVLSSVSSSSLLPPPPPKAAVVQRIKVGGNVQQANLITKIAPVYPPLAKQARIQGHVILSAVISKEGTIQDLKVNSGHPLLVQAAMDAVRRWQYKPTMLNGEPVEVSTEIDVNFTLNQ